MEQIGSTLVKKKTVGDLQPSNRVRGPEDGKLPKETLKMGEFMLNRPTRIFARGRSRTYISKVRGEEFDQI